MHNLYSTKRENTLLWLIESTVRLKTSVSMLKNYTYKTMQIRRYRLNLVPYTNIMIFTKIKPTERIMMNSVFMIFKTFSLYEVVISISVEWSIMQLSDTPSPFPPIRTEDNVYKCDFERGLPIWTPIVDTPRFESQ
jgi:hypothetical protein